MLSRHRNRNLILRTFIIALAVAGILPANSIAGQTRAWFRLLLPTTGFNSDCNTPLFRLPEPLPPDMHFDFIGLYNPLSPAQGDMRDAFTLEQGDCEVSRDEYIATTANEAFLAANGFPEPDPRLKNLRTHEIPKMATPDGNRFFLPPQDAVTPPLPATTSIPNEPLTLGEFRNVRGFMLLKCRADDTAAVKINLYNYTPHEILTVWALWLATPPGAAGPLPLPAPFGGVPNVIVPNERGFAQFKRELAYCPMDRQPNGAQLMFLDIASHLDGSVYGAVPDTPLVEVTFIPDPSDPSTAFVSPISAGIITVNRGVIRMTAAKR